MTDEPKPADETTPGAPDVPVDDRVKLMLLEYAFGLARRDAEPLMAAHADAEKAIAARPGGDSPEARAAEAEAVTAYDRLNAELAKATDAVLTIQKEIAELRGRGVELVRAVETLPYRFALRKLLTFVNLATTAIDAALKAAGAPATAMAALTQTTEIQKTWYTVFVTQTEGTTVEEMEAFVNAIAADNGSHLRLPLFAKWRATQEYAAVLFADKAASSRDDMATLLRAADALAAEIGAKW